MNFLDRISKNTATTDLVKIHPNRRRDVPFGWKDGRRTEEQKDRRTGVQKNRRAEGQKGRRTEGQKNRTEEQKDRRTEGQKKRRTGDQKDRRTEGQKNRITEGQKDRRTEGQTDMTKKMVALCNFENEPEKHTHKNISLVNTTSLSEQINTTSLHAFSEPLCKV